MQSSEENTPCLVNHWTRHIRVFNKSFQLITGRERVLKISILSNRYFQLIVLQNDNLQTAVTDQEKNNLENCFL